MHRLTAVAPALPPNEHDPDRVRRAAADILEGADYDRAEPDWLERAIEWIIEQIAELLGRLDPGFGGGGTGGGSAGITWLLLGLGIALLIWMVVRYRRTRVDEDDEPESSVVLEPARSSDEWRSEALRHEQAAQWREAVRAEYRALVADLVEADLLPDVAGRTAGEYRVDVQRDLPGIADAFDAATELFDPVWYSSRPADSGDLSAMRGFVARIDVEAIDPAPAGEAVPS